MRETSSAPRVVVVGDLEATRLLCTVTTGEDPAVEEATSLFRIGRAADVTALSAAAVREQYPLGYLGPDVGGDIP